MENRNGVIYMTIGMVGLGKMGYNLCLNLRDNHIPVVAYNRSDDPRERMAKEGVETASTLEELLEKLPQKKVIWLMVPAGAVVDDMLAFFIPRLQKGDIIIDGGNSNFNDTLKRAKLLEEKGIDFVDVGTSGGTSGARYGACTMVGAKDEVFKSLEPVFKAISVENGYLHTGANASGHYVKMIHNGIEYGMMQAIGEGFEILKESQFDLDYEKVARVWNNGSVIRSWLMELTESLFSKDPKLEGLKGVIRSSGEGLWSLQEALELKVPAPVLAMSLFTRFSSEQEDSFSNKVVAGLRNEFGGHAIVK